MFNRNKPYNDLPHLPPLVEVESKNILKKAIAANKALARMSMCCKQLPNEAILYNTLFLKEAKDSSEIENIVTTNDELYQALSSDRKISDPNTREVLHYMDALWRGMKLMEKNKVLTSRSFIEIVNTIKENNEGIRSRPGTKIVNQKTKEVIYTPPEGIDVLHTLLKNFEEYINVKSDVDPLIMMAIMHYQFEAIHPFSDGNGRTGRIINILYLVLTNLIEHPMLFLSKYIIDHKPEYYSKLKNVTEKNDWESWILYMLEAIEETSLHMEKKILAIMDLMSKTKQEIRGKCPSIYSKDLLEILFQQPYCKIKFLENAKIAKRLTASKYLQALEKIGILDSVRVGTEKLYINVEFYKLLKD